MNVRIGRGIGLGRKPTNARSRQLDALLRREIGIRRAANHRRALVADVLRPRVPFDRNSRTALLSDGIEDHVDAALRMCVAVNVGAENAIGHRLGAIDRLGAAAMSAVEISTNAFGWASSLRNASTSFGACPMLSMMRIRSLSAISVFGDGSLRYASRSCAARRAAGRRTPPAYPTAKAASVSR